MGPIGPELRERNREILAERLHWPNGALEVTRHLEVMNPGTSVWWGTGRLSDPKPGFYARRGHSTRTFYGETAIDLQNALADNAPQPLWCDSDTCPDHPGLGRPGPAAGQDDRLSGRFLATSPIDQPSGLAAGGLLGLLPSGTLPG